MVECGDCAHHIHHSGHITTAAEHFADCVLCQFLSLVYTTATVSFIVLCVNYAQKRRFFFNSIILQRESSLWCTRGPPFIK